MYQGNIKDLIPFLFRPEKLNLLPYLILLPAFFLAAFFLFRFFITKFDIKTPGRDDGDDIELINSRAEFEQRPLRQRVSLVALPRRQSRAVRPRTARLLLALSKRLAEPTTLMILTTASHVFA